MDAPSTPPTAQTSTEDALAYYKSQYELLERELNEFQTSSRELEEQLEKDVEESEKRERQLQEKLESLGYEVEEWKTKCKQAKAEANTAQNTLQKEITTLRDANRTALLKLRDMEVQNDDFERQARNTTSSLDDLESKYNALIERDVLLDAEIQAGEREREELRIENQRLRDELSDLKIEAEITQEKLRRAETSGTRGQPLSTGGEAPHSPISQASPSSRSPVTPTRPKNMANVKTPSPPSPPVSDRSASISQSSSKISALSRPKRDSNITPRASISAQTPRIPRHTRGPSSAIANGARTPANPRASISRTNGPVPAKVPNSKSLHQVRGLINQMQRLEQRVQSARSKLPAPVQTPQGSPRNADLPSGLPSTITMRSNKKRSIGGASTPSRGVSGEITPLTSQHVSRLSFSGALDRNASRPSSRASMTSRSSISHQSGASGSALPRPSSRASLSASGSSIPQPSGRPRSSLGGAYSVSGGEDPAYITPTSRRNTLTKNDFGGSQGGIPTPSGLNRRRSGAALSGISMTPLSRRANSSMGFRDGEPNFRASIGGYGDMGPPSSTSISPRKKLADLGETY